MLQNPNSRLDTAHDVRGHTTSTAEGAATGVQPIAYRRWDPTVPPGLYVISAGPTQQCAFHVVGEQFDPVYLGAPPEVPIRGVQTFAVPAGGGMVFEFVCDIA